MVRSVVQLERTFFVATRGDCYSWAERYALEFAAAVRTQEQRTTRFVLISNDVDLAARTKCEIAEQMTRRKRGYEEIFGIVHVCVAAKNRIRTADNVRFAVDLQAVFAAVASVRRGASAKIAIPDETRLVVVRVFPAR